MPKVSLHQRVDVRSCLDWDCLRGFGLPSDLAGEEGTVHVPSSSRERLAPTRIRRRPGTARRPSPNRSAIKQRGKALPESPPAGAAAK